LFGFCLAAAHVLAAIGMNASEIMTEMACGEEMQCEAYVELCLEDDTCMRYRI